MSLSDAVHTLIEVAAGRRNLSEPEADELHASVDDASAGGHPAEEAAPGPAVDEPAPDPEPAPVDEPVQVQAQVQDADPADGSEAVTDA